MPRGDIRLTVPPPSRGLKSDVPRHLVPDEFFVDGENVICRDGKLIVRPGYTHWMDGVRATFTDAGLGGITYHDNELVRRAWIASPTTINEFNNTIWVDRTGVPLTGGPFDQVRMALFQTSTDSTVIMVNNVDPPRKLVSGTNSVDLDPAHMCTAAKDVTVAFQRVVLGNVVMGGIRAPSTLLISNGNDPTVYPALNRVDLSDTPDTIMAVKALNTMTFAVYKDESQWVGIGSPDVYPFRFEIRSQSPGPMSPGAVVSARGVHYYIGQDGDVYAFDGSRGAVSIGASARRSIQADLRPWSMGVVHGFHDKVFNEIWWFYVSYDSPASYPQAAIIFNIDTQAFSSILRYPQQFSANVPYDFATDTTWDDLGFYTWDTIDTLYPSWDVIPTGGKRTNMLLSPTGDVFKTMSTVTLDLTASIDASFTTPFREYTGAGQMTRVDAVEPHWKLTSESRNIAVTLLRSNTLATNGNPDDPIEFDLSTDARTQAKYTDHEGRFVAVKQAITYGHGLDEYRGMTLYLYQRSST